MAILSKIRERSLFLIVIIGLALFAFVLDPSKLSDFFSSSKINEVGEVNGDPISRQEFAEALESYKTQTGNRVSEMQAAKTVWNNLLRQKIYENQLEQAGITVGEADIMNALYEAPTVQGDPRFQTSGIFDKDKLKEHLATIKADNSTEWNAWQNYMTSLKDNLQKTTYDNLVGAGLGASLKEGEAQYLTENTKVSADFVYVPYTSVADSLITIKKSEVQSYIDNHEAEFKVEASRDIKFVKFDVVPTNQDEEAVKAEVVKLLNDREEYSSVSKGNVIIKGLKNTTDYKTFLNDNNSDLPLNENLQFKVQVPQAIAEDIFKGSKGDVFGPYKENGFFKISKITEVTNVPDSVKASHILIPFTGSRSATAETTQTEEQVKNTADSLLAVVKSSPSKFADLAKELSVDKSNADKGGELGWFTYNTMVPEFRDYCFGNVKGDVGVVKTQFGFHIIKIEDQKNPQDAVKLATFARKIEASETTENTIFQNAETFALELSKGKAFDEAVKEKQLSSLPAVGMKALDENVPGLGNERQIITWAFEKDSEVESFKRFDVDGGYVVVTLTGKTEKGLMPVDKAISKVRPILMNKKKAEIIKDKFSGATLADVAKTTSQVIKKATDVNLKSPTISGIGYEPKIVGAMLNAKNNELYKAIVGDRGVYAFVVTGKELPTALPNYDTYRDRLATQRKNQSFKMYEAIKKASNVEDYMSSFYGIQ
ncbi:peptidylprolyl isomerase/peptidyl-prolyl cis-trans isomerase D [Tenacibaculum adriaticum]|uniref:Periplasmic chaperone PpiD n=1 Tax=Tenacibaculum adriaticum TaxID=413713 RepID=A0A5S5DPQ6_9FLAO|nr:peptidylprolyl isomerase [Tenacibaculum adriaticum]TYP97887.1 peptidylprolyl isomerase/peptidyl-prolyl cis-trans isomerase D [Tenacibaculum adriaticum]